MCLRRLHRPAPVSAALGVRTVITAAGAERAHAGHCVASLRTAWPTSAHTTAAVTLQSPGWMLPHFVAIREQAQGQPMAKELGFNIGYNDLLARDRGALPGRAPLYERAASSDDGIRHDASRCNVGLAVDSERGSAGAGDSRARTSLESSRRLARALPRAGCPRSRGAFRCQTS